MKYPNDPATRYALAVTSGEIVAGRTAIWSCQRHLDDLAASPGNGWVYRPEFYYDFEWFCGEIYAPSGKHQGKPVKLYRWHKFVFGCLLGWRRVEDESKARFKVAWVRTARKQGKTFPWALYALYLMAFGVKRCAEIYSAATKEEQAAIVVKMAQSVVEYKPNEKFLSKFTAPLNRVKLRERGAVMTPLAKTVNSLDGLFPMLAFLDEVHAYKNSKMWGVLQTGTPGQENPLVAAVTTAGDDPDGFGARKDRLYSDILNPHTEIDDPVVFAFIASLDIYTEEEKALDPDLKDDDPYDPAVWPKSNCALGEAFDIQELHEMAHSAQTDPEMTEDYETRTMNLWGGSSQASWLSAKKWDECYGSFNREAFETGLDGLAAQGAPAFGGICAPSSTDMASFCLVFPTDRRNPGGITVVPWFFLPESAIKPPKPTEAGTAKADAIRDKRIHWDNLGLLEIIPGEVIDLDFIYDFIIKLWDRFDIKEVVYKQHSNKTLGIKLGERSIPVSHCGNSHLIEPTKLIGSAIIEGNFRHFGHPILKYHFGNTSIKLDADGEGGRPIKRMGKDSKLLITGILAAVYGHTAAQYHDKEIVIDESYGVAWAGGKRSSMR